MVRAGSPNQGRKPLSPLAYPKGARPGSASVATGDGSQGVFPANSRRGASPAITREGNQDSGSETGSVFVTGPGFRGRSNSYAHRNLTLNWLHGAPNVSNPNSAVYRSLLK